MSPPSVCAQLLFLLDRNYDHLPCCHPWFDFGSSHPASNARRPGCMRLCCNHPPPGGGVAPDTPTIRTSQAHTEIGTETEEEEEERPPPELLEWGDTTEAYGAE